MVAKSSNCSTSHTFSLSGVDEQTSGVLCMYIAMERKHVVLENEESRVIPRKSNNKMKDSHCIQFEGP